MTSVTVEQLQALEKEAQALRASVDAGNVADAKKQLTHLKVGLVSLVSYRSQCRLHSCLIALTRLERLLCAAAALYVYARRSH